MLVVIIPVVPFLQFSAKDHWVELVPACSAGSLKYVGSWDQGLAWAFVVVLGLFIVASILWILPARGIGGEC